MHSTLFSPADPISATPPPSSSIDTPSGSGCHAAQTACVGETVQDRIALRRIKYIARFIYWTVRHRSTRHVAWVLAFEGFTW